MCDIEQKQNAEKGKIAETLYIFYLRYEYSKCPPFLHITTKTGGVGTFMSISPLLVTDEKEMTIHQKLHHHYHTDS